MIRTFRTILTFICLVLLFPVVAQTRISAPSESHGLPAVDRHFTTREYKRETDSRGLRKSMFNGVHHAVGGFVYGGYSTTLSSTSLVSQKPGGGDFRMGAVYEYSSGYFILQTGLGFSYRSIRVDVDNSQFSNLDLVPDDVRWNTVVDTWGMPLKSLTYNVEDRRDKLSRVALQIPLLAGVHVNHFYALAGFNFSVPVWNKASTAMSVTSRGTYERYYGFDDEHFWQEMDNHGYRKQVPLQRKFSSLKSLVDIQVCGEVGYDYALPGDLHLRVAAFASYGVLNEARYSRGRSLGIAYDSMWDFETFTAAPIWYSTASKGAQLHDLSVGVKVTVLFMFRQPDKCVLCGLHGR